MTSRVAAAAAVLTIASLQPRTIAAQEPSAPQRWLVEDEPSVVIGAVAGDSAYLFTNLRAAVVLSDGRIVALDAIRGFSALRYYDPAGRFLETVGRWGQGPFEIEYPIGFHKLAGDSLLVISQDQRFAVFGPRGERALTGRLTLPMPTPRPTLLVSRSHLVAQLSGGPPGIPPPGTQREVVRYVSYDLVSEKAITLAEVPGMQTHYEREGRGVRIYPVPFSPMAFAAAGGGLLWVARSDEPRVRGYDPEGRLSADFPLPLRAKRVGLLDRRRYRSRLTEMGAKIPEFARYAEQVTFPSTFPISGNLKVDHQGNAWVQEYETPWATGDQLWHVFDRAGHQVAVVRLPEAVANRCSELSQHPAACDRVLDVGEDYILMHRKDGLGVSQMVMHRLVKARR